MSPVRRAWSASVIAVLASSASRALGVVVELYLPYWRLRRTSWAGWWGWAAWTGAEVF